MADRVGQQLGNYRLIRLLGQGGFAEVYLGEHVYLETPAAIKVLHAQISSEDVELFHQEARTIARLIHPNIVRVLEFGVEGTTPFLVVDYAPNGTLRKRHAKGMPLPLPTIVRYVHQLGDALQYAHDQKVIHRDVKPENMLLGRRNEVLLSDFGIAVVAQSTRYQSTRGLQELAGTIAYMSPEQIQSNATASSDQYALAVVAYEWLCGSRPFQGSFAEVAVKHTLVPPPSLRERAPGLSPGVEEVVMKALAKDPRQRYETITDFAAALDEACRKDGRFHLSLADLPAVPAALASELGETILLGEHATIALPVDVEEPRVSTSLLLNSVETPPTPKQLHLPTTHPLEDKEEVSLAQSARVDEIIVDPATMNLIAGQKPKRTSRRFSRRAVILGMGAAMVAGAGGLIWLAQERMQGEGRTPTTPAEQIQKPFFTYNAQDALIWSVAWAKKGGYLASAGSNNQVQVWRVGDVMPAHVQSSHTDTVYGIAWSPDGKRVASASYDKTVQVWDATTGYYPLTYRGHSSWVWSVGWSPDGKYIASAGGDRTVQVWDAANGEILTLYDGHQGFVHSLAWSPDSQYIASASNDGTTRVWKVLDGEHQYTYRPYSTSFWSVAWSPDGMRIASASDDKTVQVWDALSGDHRYVYHGHSDFVYAVAWSPDGKRIASAGDDMTVQIWDALSGNPIHIYRQHTASVRSLSWSPDGRQLASSSWDKTVKIWDV